MHYFRRLLHNSAKNLNFRCFQNGFAFVEFDDYQDADDACYELNGRDLMGDRVTVEIARGTPHGRDRERWGTGGGGGRDRGRRGSPPRRGGRGGRDRPVWLDKYGPPTRTDYRVIVENLSSQVSWQVIANFLKLLGEPMNVVLMVTDQC